MKKETRKAGKKGIFFDEIKGSFSAVIENRWMMTLPLIFDLVFMVLYGAIVGYFGGNAVNNMYSLSAELLKMKESAAVNQFLMSIGSSLGIMIVLLYIIYCIFHGMSWRLSSSFARGKEGKAGLGYLGYMTRFARLNIFWFLLIIIHQTAAFLIDYYTYGKETGTLIAIMQIIMTILLILIAYLAFISYTFIGKDAKGLVRKAFSLGFRESAYLAPRFVFALLLLFVVNFLVVLSSAISTKLMLISGIFLLMPLFTWLRVYMHIIIKGMRD